MRKWVFMRGKVDYCFALGLFLELYPFSFSVHFGPWWIAVERY